MKKGWVVEGRPPPCSGYDEIISKTLPEICVNVGVRTHLPPYTYYTVCCLEKYWGPASTARERERTCAVMLLRERQVFGGAKYLFYGRRTGLKQKQSPLGTSSTGWVALFTRRFHCFMVGDTLLGRSAPLVCIDGCNPEKDDPPKESALDTGGSTPYREENAENIAQKMAEHDLVLSLRSV